MTIIRELGRYVRALGQKLTSENINNFGQKALHAGRVIGRKMSSTLHIASKIAASMGYPEVAAITSAGNGIKRLVQARQNIDSVRNMLNDQ